MRAITRGERVNVPLDDERRLGIIAMLQENMNAEFRATLQYICHRIAVRSRDSRLGESFKSAALDEMAHILYFSDMIDTFGGTPCFTGWPVDSGTSVTAMLQADIALEQEALERYAAQLENLQDQPRLRALVASVLADEQDHHAEFSACLERYADTSTKQ